MSSECGFYGRVSSLFDDLDTLLRIDMAASSEILSFSLISSVYAYFLHCRETYQNHGMEWLHIKLVVMPRHCSITATVSPATIEISIELWVPGFNEHVIQSPFLCCFSPVVSTTRSLKHPIFLFHFCLLVLPELGTWAAVCSWLLSKTFNFGVSVD